MTGADAVVHIGRNRITRRYHWRIAELRQGGFRTATAAVADCERFLALQGRTLLPPEADK
jgi:hypothetical protein